MPTSERLRLVEDLFGAYRSGERHVVEELLADDFTFYSPADVGIDRARYFERCWPNAAGLADFNLVRSLDVGDEVVVTYECTRTDGSRFRNTEVLTFAGSQVCQVEVYFGWNLP